VTIGGADGGRLKGLQAQPCQKDANRNACHQLGLRCDPEFDHDCAVGSRPEEPKAPECVRATHDAAVHACFDPVGFNVDDNLNRSNTQACWDQKKEKGQGVICERGNREEQRHCRNKCEHCNPMANLGHKRRAERERCDRSDRNPHQRQTQSAFFDPHREFDVWKAREDLTKAKRINREDREDAVMRLEAGRERHEYSFQKNTHKLVQVRESGQIFG